MKITAQNSLMEGGRASWESTNEFSFKVDKIKYELKEKFTPAIVNEKKWLKRLFLYVKLQLEIRKRIKELSSIRNLHILRH